MTNRYPYRHHGPSVHGSKLADYLISEVMLIEDMHALLHEAADLLAVERDELASVGLSGGGRCAEIDDWTARAAYFVAQGQADD